MNKILHLVLINNHIIYPLMSKNYILHLLLSRNDIMHLFLGRNHILYILFSESVIFHSKYLIYFNTLIGGIHPLIKIYICMWWKWFQGSIVFKFSYGLDLEPMGYGPTMLLCCALCPVHACNINSSCLAHTVVTGNINSLKKINTSMHQAINASNRHVHKQNDLNQASKLI